MRGLGLKLSNSSKHYYAIRLAVETAKLSTAHFKTKPRSSLAELIQNRVDGNRRRARKLKEIRGQGGKLSRFLLADARKMDRRKDLRGDIDLELRPSLDRIDNQKGHLKTNVNLSCIRCNLLRQDMPYDAWLMLVPTIRLIRERGLFGQWIGRGHQPPNIQWRT